MKNNRVTFSDIFILACMTVFIVWGVGIEKLILTPFNDVRDVINDNFTLISADGGTKNNILDDIKNLIDRKEVYKAELLEEIPETKVEEKTIEYSNTGTNINWNNVMINNHTSKEVDLFSMMENYTPVKKKKSPQILIVHTHGTEGYVECLTSRTENKEQNVVKVGSVLAENLKKYGFNVLHDPKMHDLPSYNGSYKNTLKTLEWYMENYDGIDLVIDVHRDAVDRSDGSKVSVVSEQKGRKAAQIMFVVGTDECGLTHNNWQENLKLYAGIYSKGNEMYPGLFRPIDLRIERFNQHITKGSVIAEFGCNGNSLNEAIYSAELLAEVINEYIK